MIEITPTQTCFEIRFEYRPMIVEAVRKIKGANFNALNKEDKHWQIPIREKDALLKVGRMFGMSWKAPLRSLKIPDLPTLNVPLPLKTKPFPFQTNGIAAGVNWQRFINGDEMGLGKAQPLDAKVFTPNGYVAMAAIKIGMEVMNSEGGISKVTGVFPQGEKDIYKITFSDNTFTECCDEHLWSLSTTNRKFRGNNNIVLPLKDFKDDLFLTNGNRRFYIPLTKPLCLSEKVLPIDAYLMGLLLGDGCLTKHILFSSADTEIIDSIKRLLPQGMTINYMQNYDYRIVEKVGIQKNRIKEKLKLLGLHGKNSFNKFIPEIYMYGSIEQRTSLLQGLLDTDGFIDKTGLVLQFTSISADLINGVQFIVQSLGGTAIKVQRQPIKGKLAYTLTIKLPPEIAPFRLERKINRYKPKTKYLPTRGIKRVEYIGKKECQCIKVDAKDSLYLTDNLILTHNTYEAIGTAVVAQCKCVLVVCDASKKYDWQNEWKDHANRRAIIIDKDTKVSWQRYFVQGYCNVFIINYESLPFLASEIRKNEDGNYDSKHIIFVDAIKYFDCIIFDEAHRLRNLRTRMYLLAQGIAWGKHFIMCLTGTPIVNKAEDMLALLRLTGKLEVFGGQRHFINYYCNGDPDRLIEMQQMLYNTCFFRRLKRDVLKQLPAKTYQMVQCDISNRKEYNAAIKEFEQDLRTYRTTHDPELRGRIQAQAILKMMKLKEISAHGKIEIAAQLINEVIEEGQKIVVFVHQRSVGDKLLALFPKAVTVRGSDSMEERDNNVRRFQNDPACNINIVSIKAGGKGITLTAASNGLFLEWPWHPTDTDQCADRIHRIGQTYPALLRFLTGRNTIDEVLYKLIEAKRSISNAVMGNEDGFNREVLDMVADSLFNNQTVTI